MPTLLDAVWALSTTPSCFVLRGSSAYAQQLSSTISAFEILAFARGAFADATLHDLDEAVEQRVDDFFWAWDSFFRAVLRNESPTREDLASTFAAVEDLPKLFIERGPDAIQDRLRALSAKHPELSPMLHSFAP